MACDLAFSFGSHERWTASTSVISDRRTAEHRKLGPRSGTGVKGAPKSSTSWDESAFSDAKDSPDGSDGEWSRQLAVVADASCV